MKFPFFHFESRSKASEAAEPLSYIMLGIGSAFVLHKAKLSLLQD
jgi:hypothetical protein